MILAALALSAALAQPPHLAPGCHRALLVNNSGEGPRWPIVLCDGDDRYLTVDGGPVGPHAVIIGGGAER